MQRALVTGVAGFIGSHLAADLLRQGWHVTGLDTRGASSDPVAAENLAVLPHIRASAWRADLTAQNSPCRLKASRWSSTWRPCPERDAHGGTGSPATWPATSSGRSGCWRRAPPPRFPGWCSLPRQASTAPGTGKPSRETDPPLPLSPYGVSKLAAERLCLAYASQPGAVTQRGRAAVLHRLRPRQRPDMAFSRIMRAALSGRAMSLYGTGAQRRDFTYVCDAVAATIAAASCEARAEVVNVASGRSVPLVGGPQGIASARGR